MGMEHSTEPCRSLKVMLMTCIVLLLMTVLRMNLSRRLNFVLLVKFTEQHRHQA